MNIYEELKEIRKKLFKEIDNVDSPISLYNVQYEIAIEIINSENNYNKTFDDEYKDHANLLRSYADTFAWLLLNQYTIKQLYNKENTPQLLSSMKDEFFYILKQAKKYAEKGKLVLIAPITNCINTTDIVICDEPSKPLLIKYNKMDISKKENLSYKNFCMPINPLIKTKYFKKVYEENNIDYSWNAVNKVVNKAINYGSGFEIVNDGDIMWAFKYQNSMPEMPREMADKIKNYRSVVVGCNLRAIEEPELLINPPSCLPIDFKCKFALMEGDIVIMHYIDANCFKEINDPYCSIEEILCDDMTVREDCFVVKSMGEERVLSSMFLNNVVYGYSTISSMATLICQAIRNEG